MAHVGFTGLAHLKRNSADSAVIPRFYKFSTYLSLFGSIFKFICWPGFWTKLVRSEWLKEKTGCVPGCDNVETPWYSIPTEIETAAKWKLSLADLHTAGQITLVGRAVKLTRTMSILPGTPLEIAEEPTSGSLIAKRRLPVIVKNYQLVGLH